LSRERPGARADLPERPLAAAAVTGEFDQRQPLRIGPVDDVTREVDP